MMRFVTCCRYSAPVRKSGVVADARGLRQHDHLCWIYDTLPEFRSRAREFLADGLQQGMRVYYLGTGDLTSLDNGDAGPEMTRAWQHGAARMLTLDAVFPGDTIADPAAQARWCAEITEAAIADGYGGLRVAVEATTLARTPDQLATYARFDQLIDRYLVDHPVSVLCGYQRGLLDEQTIARLTCLHPGGNAAAAGFRLHAAPGNVTYLAGELDMAGVELFPWALRSAEPPLTGREILFDGAELTFVDHRGLLALGDYAHSRGGTAVLRTGWPGAARIVTLLDVDDVRVEPLI